MNLLEAVILGVIQGVFEWLPVSSEAVITLVMTRLLGSGTIESVNTSVWLHSGTMLAALIYFRKDFQKLLEFSWGKIRNFKIPEQDSETGELFYFIILSTLLTGIIGGFLYFLGVKTLANYPNLFSGLMGLALILTGIFRLRDKSGGVRETIEWNDSALIGFLQGLAVVPGISRSGSTVFGLLFQSFSAEKAFRLSFLISVPAVLAANIGINLFSGFQLTSHLLIASGVAFLVGYASIDAVLKVADRAEVGYLCFLLAAISFIPLLF